MKENFKVIDDKLAIQHLRLNNFNSALEQKLREYFADQKPSQNCWIGMYTLLRDSALNFCDSRFIQDKPGFVFTLLQQYPNLMTTYIKIDELTFDQDGETSPCDFLFDNFLDIKVSEATDIGLELGLFGKEDDVINLTPNYLANSDEQV